MLCRYGNVLFIICLVLAGVCEGVQAQTERPSLTVSSALRGEPQLDYSVPPDAVSVDLLRSTANLAVTRNEVRYPVARYSIPEGTTGHIDLLAPQGVTLYYQLEVRLPGGDRVWSNVASIACPVTHVGRMSRPGLLVDKLTYTLMLMDGDMVVRRFPVALGADPANRKLHLDRASTPEGVYRIIGLQPRATFHKAFDINYPNQVDRARYDLSRRFGILPRPAPSIGGEIQIHGGGIEENWTWGCIALRNYDMDWLFSRPELSQGIQVAIAGSELRPEDLQVITSTTASEKWAFFRQLEMLGMGGGGPTDAIARFQHRSGLPLTTQLDLRTRELIKSHTRVGTR